MQLWKMTKMARYWSSAYTAKCILRYENAIVGVNVACGYECCIWVVMKIAQKIFLTLPSAQGGIFIAVSCCDDFSRSMKFLYLFANKRLRHQLSEFGLIFF